MRNRQRGAYSFLFLVVLIAGGLLVFALAADGARLYAQQRVLQQQADAAALGATQLAQACGGQSVDPGLIREAAENSAARAGYTGGVSLDDIALGLIETDETGRHRFTPTSIQQSNAVSVVLQQNVPRSLLVPGRIAGSVEMSARATARKELVATIGASGRTAVVESGLLGGLLGGILDVPGFSLTPTDIQSLQGTLVSVGELLESAGVNSLAEALPLGAEELVFALRQVSGLTGPIVQALDALLDSGGLTGVQVGDVLAVVDAAAVPESSSFPLYDTLVSLVLNVADEAVDVILPSGIGLPAGLGGVSVEVRQAPTVAIGPARRNAANDGWVTSASAPDIVLRLLVDLENILPGSISLLPTQLELVVETGVADADLVWASCAEGLSNEVAVGVDAVEGLARLRASATITPSISVPLVATVRVTPLALTADSGVVGGGNRPTEEFSEVRLNDPEEMVAAGDGGLSLAGLAPDVRLSWADTPRIEACQALVPLVCSTSGLLSTVLGFVGIVSLELLDGVLEVALQSALAPLLASLTDTLVDPLLNALGLELGSATIMLFDVEQSAPVLVRNVQGLD